MKIPPIIIFCGLFIAGVNLALALIFIFFFFGDTVSVAFFHYSSNGAFYILYILIPALAGLLTYRIYRTKSINKLVLFSFFLVGIAQLCFFIYGGIKNKEYWGYFIKRPIVFKEVQSAKKIMAASYITSTDSNGIMNLYPADSSIVNFGGLEERESYYNTDNRIFLVFRNKAWAEKGLSSFKEKLDDPGYQFEKTILSQLSRLILSDQMIPAIYKSYSARELKLQGIITMFTTKNNEAYVYAGLNGGELGNDHHPFYEFLFLRTKNELVLKRKQLFYTDFAGIEGVELINLTPFFSFLLVLFSSLVYMLISLIRYFRKRI